MKLANDEVGGDGLAYFKDLVCLLALALNGTPASDEGLVHHRVLMRFPSLHLAGTRVTPEGIANFKKAANGHKVNKSF